MILRKARRSLHFLLERLQNGDPIEMSLMLVEEGFKVKEIFATIGELNFRFLKDWLSLVRTQRFIQICHRL